MTQGEIQDIYHNILDIIRVEKILGFVPGISSAPLGKGYIAIMAYENRFFTTAPELVETCEENFLLLKTLLVDTDVKFIG